MHDWQIELVYVQGAYKWIYHYVKNMSCLSLVLHVSSSFSSFLLLDGAGADDLGRGSAMVLIFMVALLIHMVGAGGSS